MRVFKIWMDTGDPLSVPLQSTRIQGARGFERKVHSSEDKEGSLSKIELPPASLQQASSCCDVSQWCGHYTLLAAEKTSIVVSGDLSINAFHDTIHTLRFTGFSGFTNISSIAIHRVLVPVSGGLRNIIGTHMTFFSDRS